MLVFYIVVVVLLEKKARKNSSNSGFRLLETMGKVATAINLSGVSIEMN